MKGKGVNTSEFLLNLTCICFTGGGIKLLVSAEAEEAAHEGTSLRSFKMHSNRRVALEKISLYLKCDVSQVSDGFIAHFYSVCEQIGPVLAWGFLGPKGSLHDLCCFFKVRT